MRDSFQDRFVPAAVVAAALAMGCAGDIAQPQGGGAAAPNGGGAAAPNGGGAAAPKGGPVPAPAAIGPVGPKGCGYLPVRAYRLTPIQIRRSLVALLGPTAAGDAFETALAGSVPESKPFANAESVLSASPGFTETIFNNVRVAAAGNLTALNPCLGAVITRACVSTLLGDFGVRAWRRPWTDEETTSYLAFYDAIAAKSDPKKAVEYLLRRLLTAPDSLFRFELGGIPDKAGLATLTSYELASALSYTLTDAPPDAMLLTAAKQDALQIRAAVELQARRLLDRPDTALALPSFFDEYLDGDIPTALPDQVEELHRFVSHVLWNDGGKFATLLTANYTFINPALQKHYGWAGLPTVKAWQKVTPPAAEGRTGLLTLGPYLSRKTNQSARGKFIKGAYLCSVVPDPPAEVDQTLDGQKATLAKRLGRAPTEDEARESHVANPTCAVCHRLIDPIGQAFVAFDRLGVWRALNAETKKPYITAAQISETGAMAIDGAVANGRDVARALASSAAAGDCFDRHVYEFVMGRAATENDQCHLRDLAMRFATSGGDVRQAFVDVVQSDAFRMRAAVRN